MIRSTIIYLALFGLFTVSLTSHADPVPQPPIEAYGKQAVVRSISISPSGEQIAFIRRTDKGDLLYTYSADEGLKARVDLARLMGSSVWFPTEKHVIIRGYKTTRVQGYGGRFDHSGAFSYNLETDDFTQLLKGTKSLYPAQSGLGRVIGRIEGTNQVLMPAWTGTGEYNLSKWVFKVDLDKSKGRKFQHGNEHTLNWLIDTDGTMLARADMRNGTNVYALYTDVGGSKRKIYELTDTERPPFSIIGVKADRSALILGDEDYDATSQFVEMDFDGNIKPAELGEEGAGIARIFKDGNSVIHGVQYSGILPTYKFFDPALDATIKTTLERFEGSPVRIRDWSDDWSKIVLHVFDFRSAGRYILLDTATGKMTGFAQARPDIPASAIGDVVGIEYRARDGTVIPAIMTWPAGIQDDARNSLPTIIMPHGGPRSHDTIEFDWMAQYFANRGYLVLQPNFRGSSGFGVDFMLAGNGEWGGKMQDDVSDGLQALVAAGYSDPDRVCIIGWSYGGYSALAGGAFTPDLYKCIIAVAPVTDLVRMLRDERKDHGKAHYLIDYWQEMVGDLKTDRDKLEAVSPVNFAENFTAPVLLIHGKDDAVVQFRHSTSMERALKRAGKDVTLLRIKDDGHSLVESENRLEALVAMAAFVERHIGEK